MGLLPGLPTSMLAMWLGSVVILAEDPPAAAGGDLTLDVRVVGGDSKPVEKSSINLWKLVPEPERRELEAGTRGRFLWHEATAGRVWDPIGGVATNNQWRRDGLAAGTYRATGRLGHGEPTPVTVSDAVVLDGRRKSAVLVLRLKRGPTVSFRLVDAAGKQPVPGARVTLMREDVESPFQGSWTTQSSDDQGRVAIEQLAPGAYAMDVSRRADRPEELEYSAAEKRKKLVVAEGLDQVVRVEMAGRALTQPEIERRWGWVATGTVVDEFGRPLADAEVRVATGWGTLRGGGTTRTAQDGRFTLRFAEGWMSRDAANAQAAVFSVAREGAVEKSRSRPGQHLMARQMPEARFRYGVEPDKIVLKGRPHRIDFVMAEPAIVEVEMRGPADSAPAIVGQDEQDERSYAQQDTPNRWYFLPGRPWRFELTDPKTRSTVRSFPFTLPRAGRYRVSLRFTPAPQGGIDLLEIVGVTGPVGRREIRDKVVGDDPMARPPVAEALQRRGRDLLRRMAEANQPWLGAMPAGVKTYEYRFRFGEQEGRTFRVGGEPVAESVRRGISYASAVHYLAANPAGATFRQVEIGDDRIILVYTLKEPIGVSAGNGVQGTWHGFFSMPFREGVLALDARRFTPIENRSGELRETFSQYVEVEKGRFAPLAIRVDQRGMCFDWTFQVIEPKLWLFAASGTGTDAVDARVDRVRVNGADAKQVARGERRAPELD